MVSSKSDLNSLAEALRSNKAEVDMERKDVQNRRFRDLEMSIKNRIARKSNIDTKNKYNKNQLSYDEDLKVEKQLDDEIYNLKEEISKLDETINGTRRSFMMDKSMNEGNRSRIDDSRRLKEILKKKDVEIERYKIAYDKLLNEWKGNLETKGADASILEAYNPNSIRAPVMNFSEIYSNRMKKGEISSRVEQPDLDTSYADKYRKKMGLGGMGDRSKSPMRGMVGMRVLPSDITGHYPNRNIPGGNPSFPRRPFGNNISGPYPNHPPMPLNNKRTPGRNLLGSDRRLKSPLIRGNYPLDINAPPSTIGPPSRPSLYNKSPFESQLSPRRHNTAQTPNYSNFISPHRQPNYKPSRNRDLSPNQRGIPRAYVYTNNNSPARNQPPEPSSNFIQRGINNGLRPTQSQRDFGRNIGVGGYDLDRKLAELKGRMV